MVQVLSDGRVSTKCENDVFHVRNIERYYVEYMKRVKEQFPVSLQSRIQVPGFHRQIPDRLQSRLQNRKQDRF